MNGLHEGSHTERAAINGFLLPIFVSMDAANASGVLSSIGLGKIPAAAQLFIAGAVLLHLLVLVFWLFRLVSST
jgi:hypothetical protein